MNENSISRLLQWENCHQIEINGSSKLCEQYTYNNIIYKYIFVIQQNSTHITALCCRN